MANFKFVISEPETRKSIQTEVEHDKAVGIIGKKIGEDVNGDFIGLTGYTLKITGGTDKDGFPMHPSVNGSVRKKVLLSGPPGFYPKLKGQRKRKIVRGNTLSDEIVQINVKVVKKGEKSLEELFPAKPKEGEAPAGEEKPKEAEKKVEEKPAEPKTEKKPAEKPKEEKPAEPEKKEEAKPEEKPEPEKKEEPKPEKKEEKKPEAKDEKPKAEGE